MGPCPSLEPSASGTLMQTSPGLATAVSRACRALSPTSFLFSSAHPCLPHLAGTLWPIPAATGPSVSPGQTFSLHMASCSLVRRGTRTPLTHIFLSLSFQFSLPSPPHLLHTVRGSFSLGDSARAGKGGVWEPPSALEVDPGSTPG